MLRDVEAFMIEKDIRTLSCVAFPRPYRCTCRSNWWADGEKLWLLSLQRHASDSRLANTGNCWKLLFFSVRAERSCGTDDSNWQPGASGRGEKQSKEIFFSYCGTFGNGIYFYSILDNYSYVFVLFSFRSWFRLITTATSPGGLVTRACVLGSMKQRG